MFELSVTAILWFCAVGCGLMAGVYFAFSGFIMTSFAKIETSAGILAMQSINDVILRSAFMPLFFGTSVASAGIVAIALSDLSRPGAILMLSAGSLYVSGMFFCTLFFNVPLNNRLKAVDSDSAHAAKVWDLYLSQWTRWNHARTIASAGASVLFFIAIQGEIS